MFSSPLIKILSYATTKTVTCLPIPRHKLTRVTHPAPVVNDHLEYYLFITCALCVIQTQYISDDM